MNIWFNTNFTFAAINCSCVRNRMWQMKACMSEQIAASITSKVLAILFCLQAVREGAAISMFAIFTLHWSCCSMHEDSHWSCWRCWDICSTAEVMLSPREPKSCSQQTNKVSISLLICRGELWVARCIVGRNGNYGKREISAQQMFCGFYDGRQLSDPNGCP